MKAPPDVNIDITGHYSASSARYVFKKGGSGLLLSYSQGCASIFFMLYPPGTAKKDSLRKWIALLGQEYMHRMQKLHDILKDIFPPLFHDVAGWAVFHA